MENLTTKDVAARLGITDTEAYGFIQACLALGLAEIEGKRSKLVEKEITDAAGKKHRITVTAKGKPTHVYRFFAGVGFGFKAALEKVAVVAEAAPTENVEGEGFREEGTTSTREAV